MGLEVRISGQRFAISFDEPVSLYEKGCMHNRAMGYIEMLKQIDKLWPERRPAGGA